ncbi:hypothetical protein BS50DRAFT_348690 [Corynespora cassiicola Philippines]|uniref:Uncharacterized protein n=1 Tax=Corynespora cassiicola Philippines TaxID=1448308 RepID=A0A2T2NQS5_CORCC|nr:hypothetical protein BS50DRAFT_348690 [Corynespora cassiicola Philippines]
MALLLTTALLGAASTLLRFTCMYLFSQLFRKSKMLQKGNSVYRMQANLTSLRD